MTTKEKIARVKKQFLCGVCLSDFDWLDLWEDVSLDTQDLLLNETLNSDLVLKFPIQISYQKAFAKVILRILEEKGTEISDSLYDAIGRLVALPSTIYSYKHYLLNSGKIITLQENVNLISEGTTGLRTWQAALALAEFSLKNRDFFENQAVLELGSGIGLSGLVISLECNPKDFYFTDCHPSVLKTLWQNVDLNLQNLKNMENLKNQTPDVLYSKKFNKTGVHVLNLAWENVQGDVCKNLGKIDKIIAADIIYDSDLFPALISAISNLQKYCEVREFIFSCTERNQKTLELFLQMLAEKSYKIQEIQVPEAEHFIWSQETPVKIFRFTK